jgi:hypothetical protein
MGEIPGMAISVSMQDKEANQSRCDNSRAKALEESMHKPK